MLRQTIRHCADSPNHAVGHQVDGIRVVLPKLFDTHRLAGKKPGKRTADDAWVEKLARKIYLDRKPDAVGAVAELEVGRHMASLARHPDSRCQSTRSPSKFNSDLPCPPAQLRSLKSILEQAKLKHR